MSERANERVAWFNGEFMPEREVRIPFRDRAGSTATAAST